MPSDPEPQTGAATQDAPQTKPKSAAPTLSAEEQAYQSEYDAVVGTLTPTQRWQLLQLARERNAQLVEETERKRNPEPKKSDPAPAPAPTTTDPAMAKLDAVMTELRAMKEDNAKRAQEEQAQRARAERTASKAEFQKKIKEALGAAGTNERILKLAQRALVGELLEHVDVLGVNVRFDEAKKVREFLDDLGALAEDMSKSELREYLKEKVAAAEETAGQTGASGTPAPRKVKTMTAEEFDSGAL